jgi:hypothetical protein
MSTNNPTQAPVNVINKHNVPLSYDKAKAAAIRNQPIVAEYPLAAVELGRNHTIKIEGQIMPITDKAYNQFLRSVLHVSPGFVKRFKSVTDEKTELSMLSTLQKGLAQKKGEVMKILANPVTESIIGFSDRKMNYMTNESMLNVFEQVMNEYPSLELKDFYISNDGALTLNVRTPNVMSYGKSHIGEPEDYKGGLTFRNSPFNGTSVGHNALRLVCMNGMIRLSELSRFKIGTNPEDLNKFFHEITKLAQSNFMDAKFVDNMQKAMKVEASVAEVQKAAKIISSFSSLDADQARDYLPIVDVTKYLAARGIEYSKLTEGQAANCPSGMKLWDVINDLTHFGSHDLDVNADFGRIQLAAGNLLDRKVYDGENFIFFQ